MILSPGTRIGPYEVVAAIGAGGMGQVYRARDTRLQRAVAIKILRPELAEDAEYRRRFETEARAAAALKHANILAIYDVGSDRGLSFIVMELLEGRTLRRVLTDERLTLSRALELAIEIADGLAAAHAQGVVHRDLKPGNIFVTPDGRAKILDFGLAKIAAPSAGDAETAPATSPHVVLGTPGYMAPEQLAAAHVDYRADIFAFGAVLYELLSGQPAFQTVSDLDRTVAVLRESQPSLTSTPARRIPALLARVVERCLETSVESRYQSTADLAFTLRSVLQCDLAPAMPSAAAAAGTRWGRRLPWLLAATVAVITLVVATSWRPWLRPTPSSQMYRLTISSGSEEFQTGQAWDQFAISPDGTRVAYVARPIGTTAFGRMYVRRLDQRDAMVLPGTEGAARPFFSPDGLWLAFATDRDFKKVALDGTPPITLIPNVQDVGGSWGPDGTIVLAGGEPAGVPGALARIGASGGVPGPPLAVHDPSKGEATFRQPQALPDGSVLFTIVRVDRRFQVGVLPRQGQRRVLVEDASHARYVAPDILIFARGSTLFGCHFDLRRLEIVGAPVPVLQGVKGDRRGGESNFSISTDGSLAYIPGIVPGLGMSSAVWLSRSGGQERALPFDAAPYRGIRLSPDERLVAMLTQNDDGRGDVWVGDLSRGTVTRLSEAKESTIDVAFGLTWSRAGDEVAYRKTDRTVWSRRVDLSAPEHQLGPGSAPPPGATAGLWSPKQDLMLFGGSVSDPRMGQDIWAFGPLLSGVAAARTTPWLQTPNSEFPAAFSPDGKWLAYFSNATGSDELYVQAFPSHGAVLRVTSAGAVGVADWNEREIIYQNRDQIMVVPMTRSDPPAAGTPKRLFRIASGFQYSGVSRDGERFLFLKNAPGEPDPPSTEMTVIVNWIADVRQRIAETK